MIISHNYSDITWKIKQNIDNRITCCLIFQLKLFLRCYPGKLCQIQLFPEKDPDLLVLLGRLLPGLFKNYSKTKNKRTKNFSLLGIKSMLTEIKSNVKKKSH